MDDEISTVCALLHDVVEDTDITLSDLTDMGYPAEVTEVLALLTHAPEVPYMEYVAKIKTNDRQKSKACRSPSQQRRDSP